MSLKGVVKYYLEEAIISSGGIIRQKDGINEEVVDYQLLLKQDLGDILNYGNFDGTSLAFAVGDKKPRYRKKWGVVYNVSGNLNRSQKRAIRYGLKSDLTCVEGPPGNGKSEMITGLLINAIIRNQKVVIASYNNKAVDSVDDKIRKMKIAGLFIRSGNQDAKSKGIDEFVEDLSVDKVNLFPLWRMLGVLLFFWPAVHRQLVKCKIRSLISNKKNAGWTGKMRELAKDGKYYSLINKYLLDICYGWGTTTLSVKSNFELKQGMFDLLIIDEAAQCEVGSIIPLMFRAKRIVVVGDPFQLKPISRLTDKEKDDLVAKCELSEEEKELVKKSESFFDLIRCKLGGKTILLDEHYRCHPEIIDFNNWYFYDNRLKIKTRPINDKVHGMFWVQTKLGGENSSNHMNHSEVQDVLTAIKHMSAFHKISFKDIGVITPFKEQSAVLSNEIKKISPDVTCGTIHTFQGDERDYIIISLCLHDKMKIGTKRWEDGERSMINVATSRAKKGLIIVGDYDEAASLNESVKDLADYFDMVNKKTDKNKIFVFKGA